MLPNSPYPPGQAPPTFSLESSLPKFPLPSVSATLARYREAALPFCASQQEVNLLDAQLREAAQELAPVQILLEQRHASTDNYVSDWWRTLAYLQDRAAIVPIESSTSDWSVERSQIERAAGFMFGARQVHAQLEQQTYPVLGPSLGEPWSMRQFRFVFETCRIPRAGCDEQFCAFQTDSERKKTGTLRLARPHFVVGILGRLYRIDADLAFPDLIRHLQACERDACEARRPGEFADVGFLTASARDVWARARQQLVESDARNVAVLSAIETALAFVTLDQTAPLPGLDDLISKLSLPVDAGSR
jgi:carnitine O-acetyltransferase